MPYIHVNTSKTLSEEQKDAIAAGLGREIVRIPGKSEAALMVDITDGHTMYFAGQKGEFTYIGVEIYGEAAFDDQRRFAEAVSTVLEEAAGLSAGQVYLTFTERPHWGVRGSMK